MMNTFRGARAELSEELTKLNSVSVEMITEGLGIEQNMIPLYNHFSHVTNCVIMIYFLFLGT